MLLCRRRSAQKAAGISGRHIRRFFHPDFGILWTFLEKMRPPVLGGGRGALKRVIWLYVPGSRLTGVKKGGRESEDNPKPWDKVFIHREFVFRISKSRRSVCHTHRDTFMPR